MGKESVIKITNKLCFAYFVRRVIWTQQFPAIRRRMSEFAIPPGRRSAAIAILRELRRLDDAIGVRNSGIARDVALLLYEHGGDGMSVSSMSARTKYSGPTIRLVLERLMAANAIGPGARRGKTQFYALTPSGLAGCDAYVAALTAFAEGQVRPAFSPAASPRPAANLQSGQSLPPARYAGAQPALAAAD
jgi:hypothetical protein